MNPSKPTEAQVAAFEYRAYMAGVIKEVKRLHGLLEGIDFTSGAQAATYQNISEDLSICSAAVIRARELQAKRDELREKEGRNEGGLLR